MSCARVVLALCDTSNGMLCLLGYHKTFRAYIDFNGVGRFEISVCDGLLISNLIGHERG